jgi:dipeptidase E
VIGTVLALGGGGFSMSDDGASAVDDYLLDLTGEHRPRVCFVPTASGDALGYGQWFEESFRSRAQTSVLSLFCQDPWGYTDPRMLLEQDVIYVELLVRGLLDRLVRALGAAGRRTGTARGQRLPALPG